MASLALEREIRDQVITQSGHRAGRPVGEPDRPVGGHPKPAERRQILTPMGQRGGLIRPHPPFHEERRSEPIPRCRQDRAATKEFCRLQHIEEEPGDIHWSVMQGSLGRPQS